MIYLDIAKEIERKRRKLHNSIEKNGIDSEETKKISLEIDNLLNKYYKIEKKYNEDNIISILYKKSIKEIKKLTIDLGSFPTTKIWNEYAFKNDCLSSISLEYITGLNWHKLERKIKLDITKKI